MPAPKRQPAAPAELTKAPTKTHPLAPERTFFPALRHDSEDEAVTRMLCARVRLDLHDEVKLLALRRRTSLQAIVTEALEAYLAGS